MNPAAAPFPDPAELERLAWLARLISPLVHRVNNSLAVLRGACDIGLQGGDATYLDDATEAIGSVALTLSQLSSCSKTVHPVDEVFDPAAAVRSAQLLLDPLTSHHEVTIRHGWPPDATPAVVGDRERLVQILVWFAAAGMLGSAGDSAPAPRLRISLRPRGSRVALTVLCRHGAHANPAATSTCLAAARELGARTSAKVFTGQRFGTVTALRFVFSAVEPVVVDDVPLEPAQQELHRILLLDGDAARRELVRTILEERGYVVRAPDPTTAGIDGCDLVLMDADLVSSRRDLLDDHLEVASPDEEVPIAFLGAVAGTSLPQLPAPFRPGELFEFVAGLLP